MRLSDANADGAAAALRSPSPPCFRMRIFVFRQRTALGVMMVVLLLDFLQAQKAGRLSGRLGFKGRLLSNVEMGKHRQKDDEVRKY